MTLSGADGRRWSGTAPVELKVATESADAGCYCGSGGVDRVAGFSIILPAGEASRLPLSVGIQNLEKLTLTVQLRANSNSLSARNTGGSMLLGSRKSE